MSTQAALFDAKEGKRRKRLGMSRAQAARAELLRRARQVALTLGSNNAEVTIDDVQIVLSGLTQIDNRLRNAAGSVFDGPHWGFTGRWVKSKRVSNHGRMIRVWRLR